MRNNTAIGVAQDNKFQVWSVPLVGHISTNVLDWNDKDWIISQPKHLAHKIETENVVIAELGAFCQSIFWMSRIGCESITKMKEIDLGKIITKCFSEYPPFYFYNNPI